MTPALVINAVVLLLAHTAKSAATNSTWNYDQHGADWTFKNCNVTVNACDQSPCELSDKAGTLYLKDWNYNFAFVSAFKPVTISGTEVGVTNYVYTIKTDKDVGGFYVTEPSAPSDHRPIVYW